MPARLHGRSGSGLCLITPPLSVQHDFPGTIKSCLILRLQHQLQSPPPNPPPFPCSPQPATVYLMCRPFEIFTGNPFHLITNRSREAEAPSTANLCNIPFLLRRSSCPATFLKDAGKTVFYKAMPCDAPTHALFSAKDAIDYSKHSLSSPITAKW